MDKRKNNGGHSTKKKEGIDKRKNEYRKALEEAASVQDVVDVIQMVHKKAITKQDIQAAKLFLEYYLGKPDQSIDVTTSEGVEVSFKDLISFANTDKR